MEPGQLEKIVGYVVLVPLLGTGLVGIYLLFKSKPNKNENPSDYQDIKKENSNYQGKKDGN